MEQTKDVRPTSREVNVFCAKCNSKEIYFMTNEEILKKLIIKAWCINCKRSVDYIQNGANKS